MVSNAAMHWVPEHGELFVQWAGQLDAGSWIAIQMPGNFDSPSHAAVRAVARREPFAKLLRDIPFRVGAVVDTPAHYAELLIDIGCTVDAWETTYIHQLTGVIQSVQGSSFTLQSGETVFMHQGTVINPNGIRLQPGMRVSVSGPRGGHRAINANEIDVARRHR